MEVSQPVKVAVDPWPRTSLPLVGIDWILKRKAAAIEEATRLVKLEPGLEARKEIIRSVEGECREAFVWSYAYYFFGYAILNTCFQIAREYKGHYVALVAELVAIWIFGTIIFRRFQLVEAARIDLWTAGGEASLSSLIVDFPTSVKKESRNVGVQRLDLIISLLTDSKALSQLSAAERNKLLKSCEAADNMHKYRWRWQFRAIRLREILHESAKAPVKSRNA